MSDLPIRMDALKIVRDHLRWRADGVATGGPMPHAEDVFWQSVKALAEVKLSASDAVELASNMPNGVLETACRRRGIDLVDEMEEDDVYDLVERHGLQIAFDASEWPGIPEPEAVFYAFQRCTLTGPANDLETIRRLVRAVTGRVA